MADTVALAVLILIAFLSWTQGIPWLFIGAFVLIAILAKSKIIFATIGGGLAAIYLLKINELYVTIAMIAIVIVTILVKEKKGGAGGEAYSPELMRMLGGG